MCDTGAYFDGHRAELLSSARVVRDDTPHIELVVNNNGVLEEARLATISVAGMDFFSKKHKNKVPHLLNRNYGEISNKAFSLGQSQR